MTPQQKTNLESFCTLLDRTKQNFTTGTRCENPYVDTPGDTCFCSAGLFYLKEFHYKMDRFRKHEFDPDYSRLYNKLGITYGDIYRLNDRSQSFKEVAKKIRQEYLNQ